MGKIAFYDKFHVTSEILEALSKLGKEAVLFRDITTLEGILSNNSEPIDFILDINFHEEIRQICIKHNKPYAAWSFDSGIRNSIANTAAGELRENVFLFLFNYTDYLHCSKYHKHTYYMPFSAADKYIIEPRQTDFAFDTLVIMSSYRPEIRICEENFQKAVNAETTEVGKKTYEFLKFMMEYIVDKHKYIIDRNQINKFIDETIAGCGFNPFDESRRSVFCDQFGQILSSRQREICVMELCKNGREVDLFGDDDWKEIIKDQANCVFHGMAPYDKLGELYNSAKININLTQIQNLGGIPQRIMHIMAAGAFVLTNYDDVIPLTFKPGVHLETFRTFEELQDKTDYYLKHEDERKKIAYSGYQEFQAKHRMSDKLNTIFNEVSAGIQ